MNISGGARRVRYAGRIIMLGAGAVFILLACLLTVALLFPAAGVRFALLDLVVIPALVACPGAVLWLVGWIIEGFAEKDQPGQLRA
ncbi:MAG: hypothetical protein ABSE51_14160 [Terracidiphilus sp.]|jgi:hypothetical protein